MIPSLAISSGAAHTASHDVLTLLACEGSEIKGKVCRQHGWEWYGTVTQQVQHSTQACLCCVW